MSKRELGRVEVLARVKSKQLRVVDAAPLLRLSYRQAKRLWRLYREEGAAGLKHRGAGRASNRAHEEIGRASCRERGQNGRGRVSVAGRTTTLRIVRSSAEWAGAPW